MKEIYVAMDREKVLRDYMWSVDEENMENGSRQLHIFPGRANEDFGTEENPMPCTIQFVQAGNSYEPDFDYGSISVFDVSDLFDQDAIERDCGNNIGDYGQTRSDAIDDFKESNNIDDIDEISEEMKKKMEKQVDEWIENAVEYDEGVARSAMLDEITDEEKKIKYIILWY